MICPRHRIIARFERSLCVHCFREAVAVAQAKALEDKIMAMRQNTADALIRRLGYQQ